MRAYHPRKTATEAIPDLKRLWKAQTTEALGRVDEFGSDEIFGIPRLNQA
jgi:hypothetical protein